MSVPLLQARFSRGCRAVLERRDAAAARAFAACSQAPVDGLARRGRLDSPSPEEHPALLERLGRFLDRHPDCAWARVFEAFARRSLMDFDASGAAIDLAVRASPGSAALWALRGRLRFVHRLPADAVLDLERACELAPAEGWLRCWLGEARRLTGDLAGAREALDAGIAASPWYSPAYTWRAAVLLPQGRAREALEDLDRAASANPRDAWARHQRMYVRRRLGFFRGALEDARQAHRLNAKFSWLYGRPTAETAREAVRDADRIVAKHPRWAWARAWRGLTLIECGEADAAVSELAGAARALRHPWPLAWRGRAELASGQPELAQRTLARALALGAYPPANAWRGKALLELGRWRQAERELTRGLRADALSAPALAWRARARLGLGRVEAAREDARRALKILPGFGDAEAVLAEAGRER